MSEKRLGLRKKYEEDWKKIPSDNDAQTEGCCSQSVCPVGVILLHCASRQQRPTQPTQKCVSLLATRCSTQNEPASGNERGRVRHTLSYVCK